jgi:DNA-directed RNA polymerase specialized sigma24 family protein
MLDNSRVETYIEVARRMAGQWDDPDEAFSYLLATLAECLAVAPSREPDRTWVVLDWLRRGYKWFLMKQYEFHETIELVEEECASFSNVAKGVFDRIALEEFLAKLNPLHRDVVEAYSKCVLQGEHRRIYQAISEWLGVPVGTVKSRMFYAKKQLREALST